MTLEQELQVEQVSHLDLSGFSQVVSGTTIRETVARMRAERHNVCLVTAENKLIGIFTDRDVLRKVAASPEILDDPIDSVMTQNPITIKPDASAATALRMMDDNHFRNVPAVDAEGTIVGSMTHLAIVNYLATRYPIEVQNQPPRPDQFPSKAEGGD
jgi:predicted transcriptional regulator